MKFTYGIWFDRKNTSVYKAVEVDNVKSLQPGYIRALCTTRHVQERGEYPESAHDHGESIISDSQCSCRRRVAFPGP